MRVSGRNNHACKQELEGIREGGLKIGSPQEEGGKVPLKPSGEQVDYVLTPPLHRLIEEARVELEVGGILLPGGEEICSRILDAKMMNGVESDACLSAYLPYN